MAENLVAMFEAQNVEIEHFKMLPPKDIDWAEEIIDSVPLLYSRLVSSLEV